MEEIKKKIERFSDLEAWKQGHGLVIFVYQLTKKFPKDEIFGITNQMRRAAVSITSNIAEGFSRQSPKEKAQFYSIAQGSLTELQNQLLISRDVGYVSAEQHQGIEERATFVHKLITGLIKYMKQKEYKGASIRYKGFLLPVLAFILSTLYFLPIPAQAATLPKAPNNLGLVGYWPMNDGTGTRAGDASGQGNHGTLTNGPTWGAGKLGYGLRLDGTDDYVNTNADDPYDLSGDMTVSVWMKSVSTAAGSDEMLVGKHNTGSGNGWFLEMNPGALGCTTAGYIVFYYNSNSQGTNVDSACSGRAFNDGQWHHIVAVKNSSNIKIYGDGVLLNTSASVTAYTANSVPVTIGTISTGGLPSTAYTWNGSIDDVRIYNRALGAAEVARLYAAGQSKSTASNSNGLVAHWSFTDCQGLRATDFSGQGNYGTLTNGPTWGTGRLGCGLTFDGVDDVVSVPYSTGRNFGTGDFTVSLWVKSSDTAAINLLFQNDQVTGTYLGIFTLNSSGVLRVFVGGTQRDGATAILDGAWNHVIVRRTSGSVSVYVNGVLDANFPQTMSGSVNPGADQLTSFGSYIPTFYPLAGSLDDIRLYNRALSAAEVSSLYASGVAGVDPGRTLVNSTQKTQLTSGLVGYWGFNGQDTSWSSSTAGTTNDISGNGNTGTMTNMSQRTSPTAGRVGQALSFDGVNDYVGIPYSSTHSFGTGSFTLSAWIKGSTFGAFNRIFDNYRAEVSGRQGYILTVNSGLLRGYIGSGTPSVSGVDTLQAGTWYHVVLVRDGDTGKLYVNGVQDGGTATSLSARVATSDGMLDIGAETENFGFFNGAIDEVRIYNRALSAAEVKQLYYLGK